MTGGAALDAAAAARFPELAGRRVVVTGGASGIGLATAHRFLAEGACVAVFDADARGLEALGPAGPEGALPVHCDVSDAVSVESAFNEVDAAWGGLDVLIANAGISIRHAFVDITPEEWRRTMSVNLDGVFFTCQAAARRMTSTGGVILMTASTNGVVGHPWYADYNASKAGVLLLMRSMALELAPTVRVNAICPGYVATPMQEAEYTPEMLAATNRKIPLGRHATPQEIAALYAFLASDESTYLTGAAIAIDGGELAGGLASRE